MLALYGGNFVENHMFWQKNFISEIRFAESKIIYEALQHPSPQKKRWPVNCPLSKLWRAELTIKPPELHPAPSTIYRWCSLQRHVSSPKRRVSSVHRHVSSPQRRVSSPHRHVSSLQSHQHCEEPDHRHQSQQQVLRKWLGKQLKLLKTN